MSTGRHIRLLAADVANKIAAGEVVDRPASVLKELLENALDAGATQVDVEIVDGGRKLIAVSDNGSGMNRDDALMCVERHATSKIRDVEDIERITTLGFRGEALAAVSAVSRFRLLTATADSPVGTELRMAAGRIQDVREAGSPPGTRVEVRDLFFNVPARRKFLRSAETETAHLRQTFLVHALAHPAIGMSLKVDGRDAHRLPPGATLEMRIRELFGADMLSALRKAVHSAPGLEVEGYVGLPSASRSDRSEEYVFVNGRPASAPAIGHAIREGYHTLLPRDRHPCVFLFLQIDPTQVDVNVHPTKREVRFRRPAEVRDAVIEAIRHALSSEGALISDLNPAAQPEHDDHPPPPLADQGSLLKIEDLPTAKSFKYPRLPMTPPVRPPAAAGRPEGAGPWNQPSPALSPATPPGTPAPTPAAAGSPWAWCRVVGQIGRLYVVLETEDGFVIMDPHAAHERVLFEKYMNALASRAVETQGLLLPENVDLAPADAHLVRKHIELLRRMGFGVAEFGGDSFMVDALPACFAAASPRQFLLEVTEALERAGERGATREGKEEAIAQAACKAAVKARDRLTLEEIEHLVVALAATSMPYTCPHGRPTLIFTSLQELNRKFGRGG